MLHVGDFSSTFCEVLHHAAELFLGDFNPNLFERFAAITVDFLVENSRAGDEKLETFAAHCFNENGDLHSTTSVDEEARAIVSIFDTNRNVGLRLTNEAFADLTGCDLLAVFTAKWTVVDRKLHLDGCGVDFDEGECFRLL